MNPHQQNKIDIKSLNPDEQRLLRMYGKIPNKKDLLQNKLKERKYFDSGDYALSKAGKASDVGVTSVGSSHPVPENIPHLSATSPPQGNQLGNGHGSPANPPHVGGAHNGFSPSISRSPVKEGSYLRRSSAEGKEALSQGQIQGQGEGEGEPEPEKEKEKETEKEVKGKEKEEQEKPQDPEKSVPETSEHDPSPPPAREGLPIRR